MALIRLLRICALLAGKCGPPVLVVEDEDGKIAHCLVCGEIGPVCEGSKKAVLALRDQAHRREARGA